jgi:DNA-binding NarL/FixJ family response regulator
VTQDTIKVLLVDDHPVVRDGLRRIQELERRIRIVAEASSVQTAAAAALETRPDVVLMDVRLPDGDGIEACRQIKKVLPEARVLFLTSYADNRFVLAAMEAGADGYLLKESDSQRIVNAIHSILQGGSVFDPVITRQVIGGMKRWDGVNPLEALTSQELRLLAEVAKGRTDKEVAAELELTAKTARNYLDRIFAKLNVHTRTEAASLYIRLSQKGRAWE